MISASFTFYIKKLRPYGKLYLANKIKHVSKDVYIYI